MHHDISLYMHIMHERKGIICSIGLGCNNHNVIFKYKIVLYLNGKSNITDGIVLGSLAPRDCRPLIHFQDIKSISDFSIRRQEFTQK